MLANITLQGHETYSFVRPEDFYMYLKVVTCCKLMPYTKLTLTMILASKHYRAYVVINLFPVEQEML